MGVIKFSHDYPKLHGQTSAELLAVRSIRIDKNTPQELLEYDTKYESYDTPVVARYGNKLANAIKSAGEKE